jgi:hypothetical protein
MQIDTTAKAEQVLGALLDQLVISQHNHNQLHNLLHQIIANPGLEEPTPIEKEFGTRPGYVNTIKNLLKQNEKQRRWIEDKKAEIHCLNGKLADRKQQVSNYYNQNHNLSRYLHDSFDVFLDLMLKIRDINTTSPGIYIMKSIEKAIREAENKIAALRLNKVDTIVPEVPAGE